MSCPDWNRLCELRDEHPTAWDEALEHFDGCDACRDAALEAEPTLLFRGLPSLDASRDELASIKRTVSAMRRSETIQQPPRRRRNFLRAASLVAAVLAAAYLPSFLTTSEQVVPNTETPTPIARSVESPNTVRPAPALAKLSEAEMAPLVEDVDPAYGSVVQVVDQDISLVLVLPNQGV